MEIIILILLIVLIIVAIVIVYFLRKQNKQQKFKKRYIVPPKIARPSREILRNFIIKFEQYYQRQPNSNELVRLIIITSHVVIKGNSIWAHWMRWRIRLFLAAENHVWYGTKPVNKKTLVKVFGDNY